MLMPSEFYEIEPPEPRTMPLPPRRLPPRPRRAQLALEAQLDAGSSGEAPALTQHFSRFADLLFQRYLFIY